MSALEPLQYRRAVEALRSGVPNADAVRVLGCNQPTVVARFDRQLADCEEGVAAGRQAPGLLVMGGFGTGKSHLLEYLEHGALAQRFVCSRVVISKETPLYDPAKVFRAAVETARVPGVTGQAIQEIALRLNPGGAPFGEFSRWANQPRAGVSPIFPATLRLHESLRNDPELVEQVTGFWAGDRLAPSKVKQGLARIGGRSWYDVKAVKVGQLASERITFMPRLILGAGFKGWVVLIDEVELVGRYGLQQRGRAYAELARWLGRITSEQYPGLAVVAAITDDFSAAVIEQDGKHDQDRVPEALKRKGTDEAAALAARAEAGMRIIRRDAIVLEPPSSEDLQATYEVLKRVHAGAYAWSPPDIAAAERELRRAMRSHVRRWINEWDLKRLYPGSAVTTEEQQIGPTYDEDLEIEKPGEEDDAAEQ
jgi:hypothetical protein